MTKKTMQQQFAKNAVSCLIAADAKQLPFLWKIYVIM